ncbi:hypothetical protein CK203_112311 [Vitis vinifera]|uniref:Uncharacterized protein n=1 Tax=Vitis vinifera TaxID=29760 RepID=A0A438C5A5_VITVI|nr:hypothetical protein CK203_112311 [Vitis vinifera]
MCGGDFMSKNPEEAMDFLNYVAEVSRGWDEPNRGEVGKMKSQPNALNAKVGMYTLNEDIDMKAKVAAMTRRLEELELKKMCEVQAVSETSGQIIPYSICQSYEHLVEECPTILAIISRLTNLNTVQKKGRFPSQPHQNPKSIHEVEAHKGESSQVRDVKAMITLRSGKEVELPTPKPHDETENGKETEKMEEIKGKKKGSSRRKEDHDSTINENPEKIVINGDVMKKHMPRPFPQALHGKKGISNASEILEVLRQVKVNIPLLDMIKQVSTYAKFLKDLCTIKRGLNVNKKAFLTEQLVEKALLDLGARVNLLPYYVYKQLGLGELKPTSITLSLADRLVKIPRGMIEDVLVQVDNFYYPVDFVVLDMDPIEWTHATHVWQHDIGAQYLPYVQEANQSGRRRRSIRGLPEPSYLLATLPPWRRIEEILPLFNEEEAQEAVKEEAPKLILKPLPTELKYAYLEENKKCPIVISSSLTTP